VCLTLIDLKITSSFKKKIVFPIFLDSQNETIQSHYSDEKFHSSFTEDELKHDFRQVLPSENHRRKSLDHHRDYIISANDESSSVIHFFFYKRRECGWSLINSSQFCKANISRNRRP